LIIGRGGETIKLIQGECNVKLNVEHYNDPEGDRVVTISGTADAIAIAKVMINEKTGAQVSLKKTSNQTIRD
jgi:hypothetical protein